MAKLTVDAGTCIGCGACVAKCPDLFEFNAEHKSTPKKTDVEGADLECAKVAEGACPVQAISVSEGAAESAAESAAEPEAKAEPAAEEPEKPAE